jgi:hypothetical protein
MQLLLFYGFFNEACALLLDCDLLGSLIRIRDFQNGFQQIEVP